jgi:hypothetical protein
MSRCCGRIPDNPLEMCCFWKEQVNADPKQSPVLNQNERTKPSDPGTHKNNREHEMKRL